MSPSTRRSWPGFDDGARGRQRPQHAGVGLQQSLSTGIQGGAGGSHIVDQKHGRALQGWAVPDECALNIAATFLQAEPYLMICALLTRQHAWRQMR